MAGYQGVNAERYLHQRERIEGPKSQLQNTQKGPEKFQSSTLKGLMEEYVESPVIQAQSRSNLSQIINKAKKEREERNKALKRSKRISTLLIEQEVNEIKSKAPLASTEREGEEKAQIKQQPKAAKKKQAKNKGKKKN